MESGSRFKFIVALLEHRFLGWIFVPYLVEPLKSYYSVRSVVRFTELEKLDYGFNKYEREIVRLTSKYTDSKLSAKFSRNLNSSEFFNQISPDYLKQSVLPYVSKQMYQVALILMKNNIQLFEKEANYSNLYDEDIIALNKNFASAHFSFERNEEGIKYQVKLYQDGIFIPLINRKVKIVTNDPCVMVVRNMLLIFSDMDSKKVLPFLEREFIHVPRNMESKYFSNFVMNRVCDHTIDASGFSIIDIDDEKGAILSLEKNIKGSPVLMLKLKYGPKEIFLNDSREVLVILENENDDYTFYRYKRNKEWEKQQVNFLVDNGLLEDAGGFTLPNIALMEEESALYALVNWITERYDQIVEMGIRIRQEFFSKKYYTGSKKLTFDLKQDHDWFDVYSIVHIGQYKFLFIKLKKFILNGIREFELPDGQIAILPEEWFERYKQLFQLGRIEGERMLFGKHFFNMLRHRVPGHIPEVLQKLEKSIATSESVQLPPSLNATLRPYQIKGFGWMHALIKNGLGGCLADDMGLGKTLQAIALLLKFKRKNNTGFDVHKAGYEGQLSLFPNVDKHEEIQPASLIVVPTSLVHNWMNEFRKFAPSLTIYDHTGYNRNRNGSWQEVINRFDVVITTYGTLRNDKELMEKHEFFLLILDESQYIKNRDSKIYSLVLSLKAKHRIVLTGTPIENSLSDLWSQMNFLNRGLLGNYSFFKQNFQTPIENRSEAKAEEKLQLLIRPFILRRTKGEVAQDLPPLMESVIFCTMTPEQQKVYEREKSIVRNTIMASIEANGVANSSIAILQGLTRLRQLANHPSLVDIEDDAGSGKFGEIFLALSNIISEGHKVLIFSSFVKHLELLRHHIETNEWKYSILTGKTINREEVINSFQNNRENRIFLISLKAGGVGLNLTEADYVFIVDPWWNPAAENQAISRAHRIGQGKSVFVYRFITENSIEEKIQHLKDRKSELADKFINSNNPFRVITKEEIESMFD